MNLEPEENQKKLFEDLSQNAMDTSSENESDIKKSFKKEMQIKLKDRDFILIDDEEILKNEKNILKSMKIK